MIITSDQLPELWRQMVQERAASAERGLVVLHSMAEVDSACATRLLMVSGGRCAACSTHRAAHRASACMLCIMACFSKLLVLADCSNFRHGRHL